ncbi:MAG: CHAT domain-containing protein [Pseudomonadota bacterium]
MLRALILALLLLLPVASPAQTSDGDLNAFISAFQSGDLKAARAAATTLATRLDAGERPEGQGPMSINYLIGTFLFQMGDVDAAVSAFRRAVRGGEAEGRANTNDGFEVRYQFASVLSLAERNDEALAIAAALVADIEGTPAASAQIGRSALASLGVAQASVGDHGAAEGTWRRLIAHAEAARPEDEAGLRLGLLGLVESLKAMGRAPEAVPLSKRAMDVAIALEGKGSELGMTARLQHGLTLEAAGDAEEAYTRISTLRDEASATLGAGHEVTLTAGQALTRLERTVGDLWTFRAERKETLEGFRDFGDAAERLEALEELAQLQLTDLDVDAQRATLEAIIAHVEAHPALPRVSKALAQIQLAGLETRINADFRAARTLFDGALPVLRQDLGPTHFETLKAEADFISNRRTEARNAELLARAGRGTWFSDGSAAAATYSDADLAVLGALARAAAKGDFGEGFMASMNYIEALSEAGRFAAALNALEEQDAFITELTQTAFGRQLSVWLGYQVAEARGRINLAAGNFEASITAFEGGQGPLIDMMREVRWASIIEGTREFHRFGQIYGQAYAQAAWQAAQPSRTDAQSFAAAFEAVQLAGYGPAAGAVSRASARKAAENPELVSLIAELDALNNFVPGGDTVRMAELQRRIEADHPDYFALQVPEPITLSPLAASGTIAADEAIILVLPMPRDGANQYGIDGLVLAVTRDGFAWAEIGASQPDFILAIARLHQSLDPGREAAATRAPLGALSRAPAPRVAPFAFEASHTLYNALFGDPMVAELIAGKDHWTLIPFGAALPIPYAALVSEAPRDEDPASARAFRQAKWLGHQKALTIAPSVAALVDLRKRQRRAPAQTRLDYVAFGDPAFAGEETALLATADGIMTRSGPDRAAQLSALPKLPGTRREVETLADLFDAGPEAVALGAQATEGRLRALAADGTLGQARILHFATHGLLSGSFSGLAEPALALTPVIGAGEEDDGLLTASEAARLDLNAEWVILSACDTAGREGVLGDGLGALAQGFFAAGAQSLLLSHWRVDDRAAEVLSTGAVTGAERGLTKAQALREAMRALAADTSRDGTAKPNAHPSVWAPFVLIGGNT